MLMLTCPRNSFPEAGSGVMPRHPMPDGPTAGGPHRTPLAVARAGNFCPGHTIRTNSCSWENRPPFFALFRRPLQAPSANPAKKHAAVTGTVRGCRFGTPRDCAAGHPESAEVGLELLLQLDVVRGKRVAD